MLREHFAMGGYHDPFLYKMHKFTLHFPDPVEARYRDHYFDQNLNHIRRAGMVATALWCLFGWTDLLWAPTELIHYNAMIRYALVLPVFLLTLLASWWTPMRRAVPGLLALAVVFAGFGLILMNDRIPVESDIPVEVGFVLLTMAGYTFFRLSFALGLAIGIAMMLLTVLNGALTHLDGMRIA